MFLFVSFVSFGSIGDPTLGLTCKASVLISYSPDLNMPFFIAGMFRVFNMLKSTVTLKDRRIFSICLTTELHSETIFPRTGVLRIVDPESLKLHIVFTSHCTTEQSVKSQSEKGRLHLRSIKASFGKEITEWGHGSNFPLLIYLLRICSKE